MCLKKLDPPKKGNMYANVDGEGREKGLQTVPESIKLSAKIKAGGGRGPQRCREKKGGTREQKWRGVLTM